MRTAWRGPQRHANRTSILMDLQLPGLDGTQALRLIRADPVGAAFRWSPSRRSPWPRIVNGRCRRASTAISASRSVSATFPARWPATCGRSATTAEAVTILAVDDQPANLRLLDAVLSPRGYRVVRRTSGEEALERPASGDIDLVLLDIVMPGIDGYEVCRRIRAHDGTAFLPVVMITASGEQEKRRAIEAGADDFVNKPFKQRELLARVASLARIKRYHDTITRQAAELAAWNAELEARVTRSSRSSAGQSTAPVPVTAGCRVGHQLR